jgi:hypothetical protein
LRIYNAAAIEVKKMAPMDPVMMRKILSEIPIIDARGFDAAFVRVHVVVELDEMVVVGVVEGVIEEKDEDEEVCSAVDDVGGEDGVEVSVSGRRRRFFLRNWNGTRW